MHSSELRNGFLPEREIGLYVHIPFCRSRCKYCDFFSCTGMEAWFVDYVHALIQEAAMMTAILQPIARTLYIGGGTPTVLPIELLEKLIGSLRGLFHIPQDAEITVEANPGTVSEGYLSRLHAAGANRLSLGAQTFDAAELQMLGRIHDAPQIGASVGHARTAGFDNLNLDLIYGLPGQGLSAWTDTLRHALALAPQHLSLYALTIEAGTQLQKDIAAGRRPQPDPDLAADMYLAADQTLAQAGYRNYEISNWSQTGFRSAHNMVYWHNHPYLGLGASAHSSSVARRWWNVADIASYIEKISTATTMELPSPAIAGTEIIDLPLQMGETMMLGLRLTEDGVSEEEFGQRFGQTLSAVYGRVIPPLIAAGLLERREGRLRLSKKGRLLGNQVFARFLP